MHPAFKLSDTLPVPAGQSPFHVRGRYYDRLVTRARKVPGGFPAFLAELRDDDVRKFLQQKFNWSQWYDAMPTMPAHAALCRLARQDFEAMVIEGSRNAARDLVPRYFRFLLQLAGPQALAGRVVAVIMQAVDFVQVSLDRSEDGRISGVGTGIPIYIAPNIAGLVVGWFTGLLELGGARDIRGRILDVQPAPPRGKFEIVTIRFEFTWTRAR